MATNLLIGYADIPLASEYSAVSNTTSSTSPYTNLFGGNKTDLMYVSPTASGDTRISFRLPTGIAKPCDFLYLGRANLLQQAAVGTITLKANSVDNYATASTVKTLSAFGSTTLYGPNLDDYVESFTASSGYRYWWVNYNASAASTIAHSKLFFGSAFDPGIDPNASATITRLKVGGAQRRSTFSLELSWEGMTYAKAVAMYTLFYRTRRYIPIVLFTRTWHDILMCGQWDNKENRLRYSEQFNNGVWLKTDSTITSNSGIAPDGTTTADLLTTTVASNPNAYQVLSSFPGQNQTWAGSIYLKANTSTAAYFQLFVNGGGGVTHTAASVLEGPGAVSGVGTTGITISGLSTTQWTRVRIVGKSTYSSGSLALYIKNRVAPPVVGDSIYIWGAQLQESISDTEYVATTDTAKTRGSNSNRALFCRITDMQLPPRVTDFCDVSATFEELP